MVYHHTLATPYLFPVLGIGNNLSSYDYLPIYLPIEDVIRNTFKICVSLFAFITGYGLFTKCLLNPASGLQRLRDNYKVILKHLYKFYKHYWVVFFIFVPIGLYGGILSFRINDFLLNLVGYESTYNGTWWYVWEYVTMLLLFPLIEYVISPEKYFSNNKMVYMLCFFTVLVIYFSLYKFKVINIYPNKSEDPLNYILVLIEGLLFSKYNIFSLLKSIRLLNNWGTNIIGLALCFHIMVYSQYRHAILLATPILIFSFISLLRALSLNRISNGLCFIGRYSVYIWLTHFFYLVLYFQRIALLPRISWLIGIWVIILSLTTGIVLNRIYNLVFRV
jgi:hypothetical protein